MRAGLLLLLLATAARGDSNVEGIPSECQVEVVECATDADDATRPPPRALSSSFLQDAVGQRSHLLSPDGRTLLVPLKDGVRLVRDGRREELALAQPDGWRQHAWLPDSRRVALWILEPQPAGPSRRALALLDTARPGRPCEVVYRPGPGLAADGFELSSDGEALLVLATDVRPDEVGTIEGVVLRAPLVGGAPTELLRLPGPADFIYGSRSACAPGSQDRLLVGHLGRLLVVGERGESPAELPDVPAMGVHNLAWSPDRSRDRLLLFFRRPATGATGRTYQGLYLLDLDGALATPPTPPEELDDAVDLRAVHFSPRGTYATWSSARGVWFRAPAGGADDVVEVALPVLPTGEPPPVKGFAWSADESRLAITAGNQLYVYDPAARSLRLVAERGAVETTFLALPAWSGDRVVVAAYEDLVSAGKLGLPRGNPFRGGGR